MTGAVMPRCGKWLRFGGEEAHSRRCEQDESRDSQNPTELGLGLGYFGEAEAEYLCPNHGLLWLLPRCEIWRGRLGRRNLDLVDSHFGGDGGGGLWIVGV